VISAEVARLLAQLSDETRRQIGILVGRRGSIETVIVGDQKGLTIPDLSRSRTGILRLRGLRLIHTHLQGEPLTEEDLTDLALLRLDMMVALTVNRNGDPGLIYSAHLLPDNREKKAWEVDPPVPLGQWDIDFLRWIQSLEDEFQRGQRSIALKASQEKAILLSVGRESREALENSIEWRLCRRLDYPKTDAALPHDADGKGEVERIIGQMHATGSRSHHLRSESYTGSNGEHIGFDRTESA
jgi:GTP-binding protein HflX